MKILDIAYSLPTKRVTNNDLISWALEASKKHLAKVELTALEERISQFFRSSGSGIRYHRAAGERAIDFAVSAGRKALAKAGMAPEDVDLLIYTGVGRGWVEPATANLFHSELGLRRATCFDVLDACASWIRGLSIAKSFLDQASYNVVMLLNCEFNFREYCESNLEFRSVEEVESHFSALTIGEAATATLLTREDSASDDSSFTFRSWGDKHGLCKVPLPNDLDFSPRSVESLLRPMAFFTASKELIRFTTRKLIAHFRETSAVANRVHDLIIGHTVSESLTSKVVSMLGLDSSTVFETHGRFGNTVSASLPLALAVAAEEGRLVRDMRVLLLMGSAGVTTAVGSFRY